MKIKRVQVRGSLFHFLSIFVQKQVSEYLHMCACTFPLILVTDFDIIYHPLLSYLFCFFEPSSFFFRPRRSFLAHRLSLSLSLSHSQPFFVTPSSFVLKHCYIFTYLSIYICINTYIYIYTRERVGFLSLSLSLTYCPLSPRFLFEKKSLSLSLSLFLCNYLVYGLSLFLSLLCSLSLINI